METAILKYFSHQHCNVCKVLMPKVKQLLKQEFPKMAFQYVNIEEEPEVAASHQVFTVPTILVLFEGREYYRFARNVSIVQLKEAIERPYHLLF
ncbi:thioredoxin family protein [Carboxylicivirga sediminis]|uniref:Thioredoxin family protein n=1 Tax=Carboxylicivirga sediminis TaxID=2006564 RepID=A0A941F5K1_9BACT|nr:thioredoxin family protein [Carboxylicivirga sediminis]MBR8536777.1 thioredoxin family protein [Carboxylicivirga sediminis]